MLILPHYGIAPLKQAVDKSDIVTVQPDALFLPYFLTKRKRKKKNKS